MINDSSLRQVVGTVLLCEGDPRLSDSLQSVLTTFGCLLTVARSRDEILYNLQYSWNLIIVDLSINQWDALMVLGDIREAEAVRTVPCLAFIASEDPDFAVQCLKLGAHDYVTKLAEPEILLAKIEAHLRFSTVVRRLAKQNQLLQRLAAFDELTGLFNSRSIKRALAWELERAGQAETPTGLLLIDLDHFKNVNDTFGHQAGDDVLAQMGIVMQNNFRSFDSVGRYGGEEFCAVLPRVTLPEAEAIAERLRETVMHLPFESGGKRIPCTISVGLVWIPAGHKATLRHVLRCTDAALYESKRDGRNRVTSRDLRECEDEARLSHSR